MAGGQKLSRKKELAIAALLATDTVEQAAKKAGCSERSLWRWMKDQDFQRVYKGARRDVMKQAIGRLQDSCSTAVATLEDVMRDAEAPASARVSAARTCLEFAQRAVETEELAERIEEMEDAISQVGG